MSDKDKRELDASKAQECINRSRQMAQQMGHEYWMPEHLLLSLMSEKSVMRALLEISRDEDAIKGLASDITDVLNTFPRFRDGGPARKTQAIVTITDIVTDSALFSGKTKITALDVLMALFKEKDSTAVSILKRNGFDPVDVQEYIDTNEDAEQLAEEGAGVDGSDPLDQPAHERVLRKYCTNLNEKAKESAIDPLIGRTQEIDEMILALARRYKKNVVLTGNPGVGKTAIVEGLALKINEGKVPDILKDAEVWSLDVSAVVAGAKFRGDMEDRMKNIIKALGKIDNPILFIDEIHMMMGAGASGSGSSMDMANILKPALARGEFRCIGATTDDEYREYFESDKALVRRFMKLRVEEPSVEDAKLILKGIAPSYEEYHGVTYEPAAIDAMVDLSNRYITNKFLPDKAIDVMDIAGAARKIRNSLTGENDPITVLDIQKEVAKIAKVPAVSVEESETEKLAHLEGDLKSAVYDQDNAVETLSNTVLLARSGLRSPTKTLGNYLFVGPSGTGKTETCKQLAETMAIKLVRFDMSEYMEPHSISKLIGSPPGYVGFGDGQAGSGLLINAIEENPHSILLLDEIEKAHPDVFNIFLQVMDNGTLTSSSGKTVNCRNLILVMTSNVGAATASKDAIGFGRTTREGAIDQAVQNTFTPEFRNRLDAIVTFKPLSKETMLKIVDKFIAELNTLSQEKKVTVVINDDVRAYLAEEGYDPKMGARPLSRVIDSKIKLPLSKKILFGDLKNGGIVHASLSNNEIVFKLNGVVDHDITKVEQHS